jgi:hypothetical protein
MSIMEITPVSALTLEKAEVLLRGVSGGTTKAVKSAMQRAVSKLKTSTSKAVRERYAISASVAKTSPSIRYTIGDGVSVEIAWKGGKIQLSKFQGSSTSPSWDMSRLVAIPKKGSWVQVHPGKEAKAHVLTSTGAQTLTNTFVARFQSGHAGIFERTGGTTSTGAEKITEKMGLSVPQMVGNDQVYEGISAETMETLDERLNHEILRLLGVYG